MNRHDYAFPFRIDPASGQGARTTYEAHVDQMIRQILLTAPGERADLPDFGCGLRKLVFAPHSDALEATTRLLVLQSINKWLSDQVSVTSVTVDPTASRGDASQLLIRIDYQLIETRSSKQTEVIVF